MKRTLSDLGDLADLPADTVIDARSPAEYAEDHLPGAINLPSLSDAERAEVGTIYVQQDRFLARKVGAAYVARNVAAHLQGALADKPGGWRPLVYCWRGGQRSGAFATILAQIGWRVQVLDGGYQSYRRLVSRLLYDTPLALRPVLLDGNTGTAKTRLLALLAARGWQVIDLEALANHRGSALGAQPGGQPGQKLFEGRLAQVIARLDPTRPVVIEAESSKVGDRNVPPSLWQAMRNAPVVEVTAPHQERARFLAQAYADIAGDIAQLSGQLDLLRPLRGHQQVDAWHSMAAQGDLTGLASSLIEQHYDPGYARARKRDDLVPQARVSLDRLDEDGLQAALPALEAALSHATAS
ncbi:tRNA 2-selenouridine(34) synthase MnmH [Roseovarius gahaiensis]|uniref:tRNA 2-selenouridine(34) synthase MnmH n=1 Tax=Roseovarius gahaiensis TaxID=2716691 RepID=A0A967BJ58_9RHOB|nr:tRNA 2-selenouridine(34) synthase MnmH [Roseovarius gahaiensis]NHQ75987.1 tRNA 2-selenouridine(34) synthase MnmH [Roseovarius gahaiensis]